jgi:selenophosphate synthase
MASKKATDEITNSMSTLNRKASEIMQEIGVNACTDITVLVYLPCQ